MFCKQCGSSTNGASFCPNCGSVAANQYPVQQTNGMAIALVVSLVCCGPLGMIFGFVALSQINNSGGRYNGKGMAIAGIVIGIVGMVFGLFYYFVVLAAANSYYY